MCRSWNKGSDSARMITNSHSKQWFWSNQIIKSWSVHLLRAQLQTTETTLARLRKKRFTRYSGVYKITEGAGREVLWVRVQTKLLETTSYSLNHVITSMTRKTVAAAGNQIWRPVTAEPSWFWPSFVSAKEMPHFLPFPCLTGLPGHLLQVLVIGRRRSHAGS